MTSLTRKVLGRDFVENVRDGYAKTDDTFSHLSVAAIGWGQDWDYFVAALRKSAAVMKPVLWTILSYGPDEFSDDPGAPMEQRAKAAYWLLYGDAAGLWSSTEAEKAAAGALVLVHFKEAPVFEKTKADLAREAGVDDAAIQKAKQLAATSERGAKVAHPPKAKRSRRNSPGNAIPLATMRACMEMERDLKSSATYAESLDVIERWMIAVGRKPDREKLHGGLADAIEEILK